MLKSRNTLIDFEDSCERKIWEGEIGLAEEEMYKKD